jgi:hypothetical protein
MKFRLVLICLLAALAGGCSELAQPSAPSGEMTGTVHIVNIGATWCSECVYEMGALERITGRLKRVQVTVLLLDNSSEAVERFKKSQNITLPMLYDRTGTFGDLFHVTAVPKSLVYGCDGTLRAVLDEQLGTSMPAQLRHDFSWSRPEGTQFLVQLLDEESCRSKS